MTRERGGGHCPLLACLLLFLVCDPCWGQLSVLATWDSDDGSTLNPTPANEDPNISVAAKISAFSDKDRNDQELLPLEYPPGYKLSKETAYITHIGVYIVSSFLCWVALLFAICAFFALKIHTFLPKCYRKHFLLGPQNTYERVYAPLGLASVVILLNYVFWTRIYPRKTQSEEDPTNPDHTKTLWFPTYRLIGVVTVSLVSFMLSLAAALLYYKSGNRAAALLMGTFLSLAFMFLITFQIIAAAMVGEWGAFSSRPGADGSLSSSMDYIPGQILGAFGLSLVGSGLPIVEVLHSTQVLKQSHSNPKHTKHVVQGYPSGRALRVFLAALSEMGLTWVTLSPMVNPNSMPFVTEDQLREWGSRHYLFAIVGFFALGCYIAVVTADNVKANSKKYPTMRYYVGFAVAVVGVVGLLATFFIIKYHSKTPLITAIFGAAEVLMIAAIFPSLVFRYTPRDVDALRLSMAAWGRQLEIEKQEQRAKDNEADMENGETVQEKDEMHKHARVQRRGGDVDETESDDGK